MNFHVKKVKKLTIYIVEDEPLIAATIETALLKQGFKVVGESDEAVSALNEIMVLRPNLVLLDIQLEGNKDGVDLALDLDELRQPYIYLTSQTDSQTIERIKGTKPIGYIAKPFTETGLRSNIEISWHNYKTSEQHYLTIKDQGRLLQINQETIYYLKAYDNYCYVVTKTKTYLVPHTLKHTFQQLESTNFLRTHRSYVVNLKHILSVGKNNIVLKNNDDIPLSASQKNLLVSKLKNI